MEAALLLTGNAGTGAVAAHVASAGAAQIALAGIGASTLSQVQSARFQSDIAQQNQSIARQSAKLNARNVLVRGQKRAGLARARRGASGLDPNAGSALDLEAEAAGEIEFDRLTALFGGEVQARDNRVREIGARRRVGRAATSGLFASGTTIFGGNTILG